MIAAYIGRGGLFLATAVAVATLAACGGDADRPPPAEQPVAGADPAVGADPGAVHEPVDTPADAAPVAEPTPADDRPDEGTAPPPPAPRPAEPAPETPVAVDPAVSTDAILRATARAYEGVRSIRASFVQQMHNPLLGRTTRSAGTLYQRQPDRFLMDFSDPEGDVIVSDGEFFWLYYPSVDARQVIRTPRGPHGLDLHAQFIGDPVRRFEATYHGREAVRGRQAHVLDLLPREPLGYRMLKVWIDADDHLVRRFELTEENGNVRHFELYDLAVNPSLPDDLFRFTPPPGAQVVQR
jgi:outer membrane lipoprotein carrier protein